MNFKWFFWVCWAQACALHLLVAIERSVAQIWPQIANSLFDGPRIWPWLLFAFVYSLYYGFLLKPAVLNSNVGRMSPDPFAGYRSVGEARKNSVVRISFFRNHTNSIIYSTYNISFELNIRLSFLILCKIIWKWKIFNFILRIKK